MRGKKVGPGEQVASNKAMHCNMQLFENPDGEYYPVVEKMERPALVRGEYHPIGNRFNYPKQWGKKYAAKVLLGMRSYYLMLNKYKGSWVRKGIQPIGWIAWRWPITN